MGHPGAASATRPRYPRIVAAGGSLLVTLVAALGGVGLLPVDSSQAQQPPDAPSRQAGSPASGDRMLRLTDSSPARAAGGRSVAPPASEKSSDPSASPDVPPRTGTGRRVVFDMSSQRVWLVGQRHGADTVRRTYLVSGSVTDNLHAGSYEVYSKSKDAVGVDDSGTMRFMVRFTRGANAAIGFHDIPLQDGSLVQTRAQLGTPRSHGCIRQWRPDARALWRFAPVGTKVVVI